MIMVTVLKKTKNRFGIAYGHKGLSPGYQSLALYIPDHDLAITGFQSVGPSPLPYIADQIAGVIGSKKGFRSKEFVPNENLSEESIDEGLHIRFKTVIDSKRYETIPFYNSVGYAIRKMKYEKKSPYGGFKASIFTLEEKRNMYLLLQVNLKAILYLSMRCLFYIMQKSKILTFLNLYLKEKNAFTRQSSIFKLF